MKYPQNKHNFLYAVDHCILKLQYFIKSVPISVPIARYNRANLKPEEKFVFKHLLYKQQTVRSPMGLIDRFYLQRQN